MNIIYGETLVREKTSFGKEVSFSTMHLLVKSLALLRMRVSSTQLENQETCVRTIWIESGFSPD